MISTTIIATVFVIGLLVIFHEFGHFITAKMVGMRVDEFAVGFGPRIAGFRHGETQYSLRLVPLGGFVKIAGMDPDEEQDSFSYQAKPIWARMLVIAAGSIMNFVLPILLFIIVFLGAGIDTDEALVGGLLPDKPAAKAGLLEGDRLVAVNGAPISTWTQFVGIVQSHAGTQLIITYDRSGTLHDAAVTPEYDSSARRGIIGVTRHVVTRQPGIAEAVTLSFKQTFVLAGGMLAGIGEMIIGRAPAEVAGPIGVAQMAGQVAQYGLLPLLKFAAFLSINLGLINLLPVPVLDGGHLVTLIIEGVRGKPLSREKFQWVQMIGFTLLMLLLLLATYKDISRLF